MPIEPTSRTDVTVVVPLNNERPSLRELCAQVHSSLGPTDRSYEIIFVDDGSTDGSWDVIAALASESSSVRGIRLEHNAGKSGALSAGFAAARGDVVVTIDADLQDDAASIPRLLDKIDAGFDLVQSFAPLKPRS